MQNHYLIFYHVPHLLCLFYTPFQFFLHFLYSTFLLCISFIGVIVGNVFFHALFFMFILSFISIFYNASPLFFSSLSFCSTHTLHCLQYSSTAIFPQLICTIFRFSFVSSCSFWSSIMYYVSKTSAISADMAAYWYISL